MTVGMILYAWLVTILCGAVACGAEVLVRSAGRQARWIWAIAGLASVLFAVHPMLPSGDRAISDDTVAATVTLGPALQAGATGTEADALRGELVSLEPSTRRMIEAPGWPLLSTRVPNAFGVWAGLSALLLVLSLVTFVRLRMRTRRWRRGRIEGVPVLLSRDFGPAAVGLLRGRIVLPAWVVDAADREQLHMAVVHELEHLRGRDLPLLALVALLVVAMPWNLPLWWQARRLSRSVELDCDRRVVRRGHDPRAYGELLIAMSGRGARPWLLAPALGRRSLLRTRIEQLARRNPGRIAKTLTGVHAVAAFVTACTLPTPTAPVTTPDVPGTGSNHATLPVVDASIVDGGGVRALTSELAKKPAVKEARGVVALAVRADVASGAVRHVRVDRTAGPSVSSEAVQATVTEVATRLRVRARAGQPPEGWIPVWILFTRSTVEAHLVKHELYQEKDWPDDAASLGRHMDVFHRLRTGIPGDLDFPLPGEVAVERLRGLDPSYAMAASDRPGLGAWASDGSQASELSLRLDDPHVGEGR